MRKILLPLLSLTIAAAASAEVPFEQAFNDSTLRIDYIFAADRLNSAIYLNKQVLTPGWHGRRHNLDKLPLAGAGQIDVVDIATGDTIYRHSFSSLFQEWLATDEAITSSKAFENTYLVPQPKAPARIDICLLNWRRDTIARTSHVYDPADVLVRRPATVGADGWRYLHKATNPGSAINIAILGEGYTAEQMPEFYKSAQAAVDEMLRYEPYHTFADRINFIAVDCPSHDTGVSIPRFGDWRSTPFGSHFSTFYADRYLTAPSVYAIHDALLGVPYEHIIILANTDEYGGGGIYNSYTLATTGHPSFLPVVVHEFGHSFGGLADEYAYEEDALSDQYPLDIEPWEQNITTLVDFDSKWKGMLKKGAPVPTPVDQCDRYPVGVFEGGGYKLHGVYRPADECRMRNNTYPTFCPVCQAALTRLILFYLD